MLLSGLLRTYNEEKNLPRCLDNLFSFCDEVVISDGGSTDATKYIASHYYSIGFNVVWLDFDGGSISSQVHFNHAGRQLNFGLAHCSGEWVITQDVDLIFCQRIVAHIRDILETTTHDAFMMHGVHLVGDRDHYAAESGTGPGLIQLFRNDGYVRFPDIPEHAHHVSGYPWKNPGLMRGGVYHFGYMDRNWELEKIALRAKAVPDDATYKHLHRNPPHHDPQPVPWERCSPDCESCWMEEKSGSTSLEEKLMLQKAEILHALNFARENMNAALLTNNEEEIDRHAEVIRTTELNLAVLEQKLQAVREEVE